MRLKGILITLVIIISIVFAIANWQTLTATLPINLLFLQFEFPLGLGLLLTAVLLSVLFFFVSLLDRAGQLRQITNLERQLQNLQGKLEKKRLGEFETLESSFAEQLTGLVTKLAESAEKLEGVTRESLGEFETRSQERFNKLEERVLLVRNELAADVASAQEALQRFVKKS